jgi:hypothetical protein
MRKIFLEGPSYGRHFEFYDRKDGVIFHERRRTRTYPEPHRGKKKGEQDDSRRVYQPPALKL